MCLHTVAIIDGFLYHIAQIDFFTISNVSVHVPVMPSEGNINVLDLYFHRIVEERLSGGSGEISCNELFEYFKDSVPDGNFNSISMNTETWHHYFLHRWRPFFRARLDLGIAVQSFYTRTLYQNRGAWHSHTVLLNRGSRHSNRINWDSTEYQNRGARHSHTALRYY